MLIKLANVIRAGSVSSPSTSSLAARNSKITNFVITQLRVRLFQLKYSQTNIHNQIRDFIWYKNNFFYGLIKSPLCQQS